MGDLTEQCVNVVDEKNWILSQLATVYSEDIEFLKKVNKITFGLMSGN